MHRQNSQRKKKTATFSRTNNASLESSLTSMDWLLILQVGENPSPSSVHAPIEECALDTLPSVPPAPVTLPTANHQQKLEPKEVESSTATSHLKPPFSYVTLIQQAISSATAQKMTLNEIYQWILDSYPYFRTAPQRWKNSIRHNLSLNKCFKRLQRTTNDPGKGSYWTLDNSNQNNRRSQMLQHRPELQSSCSSIPYPTSLELFDFEFDISKVLDDTMTSESATTPIASMISPNEWNHDIFSYEKANSCFENSKSTSNVEAESPYIDAEYYEFVEAFSPNSAFQQQDQDILLNHASPFSSVLDYTDKFNSAQKALASEPLTATHLSIISNETVLDKTAKLTSSPVFIDDETSGWHQIASFI